MSHKDWGGDAAEEYPVELGQVWGVGPHILACGDLQKAHAQTLLDRSWDPDITYTDPPWNKGIATAFRTQAAMPEKVNFGDLMFHLAAAVRRTKREAIIEMGIAETGTVCQAMAARGAMVEKVWSATYSAKKLEMRLIHLVWHGSPSKLSYETLHGWDASRSAMLGIFRPGDKVFDPCLGQGGTLRLTAELGGTCIGMELNPKRLSTALALAAELTGEAPKLIDDLT